MMHWNTVIRDLLAAQDISLTELAQTVGCSEGALKCLLQASAAEPCSKTASKLSFLHFQLRPDRYVVGNAAKKVEDNTKTASNQPTEEFTNKRSCPMWPKLISEITAKPKYSLSRIAREVGVSAEAIRRLRQGEVRQPKFTTGERIFAIHLRLCPERYVIGAPSKNKSKQEDKPHG